jgi:1-deoxy-D-xylulose-5-phosphate reductoisomerase
LKNIAILGSSGSIGHSTLWVVDQYPEEFNIFGLAVGSNLQALSAQIKKYHPSVVCAADDNAKAEFAPEAKRLGVTLLSGQAGLEALASDSDVDIVLNAVVGFAGLRSTLAAARAGKRIALANKESMVAGGELVNRTLRGGAGELIPVDSEHSAIFQCLMAGRKSDVKRLVLTSSGGPFRSLPPEKLNEVTVEQALKHPTWNMGRKITVDSATLMNKGLEIIEAVYLFGMEAERIDVVIHPQSIVHSMVEYTDGSIIAQLSKPDMRLPIEYALFYPERRSISIANLDFGSEFSLDFEPPDETKFKSLNLARQALRSGGAAPAIFNAANEVAVEAFLSRKLRFVDIFNAVENALNRAPFIEGDNIESITQADINGRESVRQFVLAQPV